MKLFDYGSSLQVRIALCAAVGCAAALPLGCGGDDSDPNPTGTAGTGGAGGSAGTGGTGGTGSDDFCGGITARTCPSPETQFCDYQEGAACGASDGSGVCRDRPSTCPTECMPVCGCDGKVYCNACEAQRAGVDVQSNLKCPDASTFH